MQGAAPTKALSGMTNPLESSTSSTPQKATGQPSGWFKLGIVAAASALAGGLAAALWYRNTVKRLLQAEEISLNPHFGNPGDEPAEDT
jgi:hypothetical protein